MAGERIADYMDFYFRFGERDARQDYLRGRADAERKVPKPEDRTLSIHEQRFVNESEAAINAYRRSLQNAVDTIDKRIQRLTVERDSDYKSQQEAEQQDKADRLRAVESRLGEESPARRVADASYDLANRRFNKLELDLKREPHVTLYRNLLGVRQYFWLLIVLFIFELPINFASFGPIFQGFGQGLLLQLVMTLFVAVVLILFAHVVGKIAKQFRYAMQRPILTILMLVVLLGIVTLIVYGLYLLREPTFGQLVRSLLGASAGPAGAVVGNAADAFLNQAGAGAVASSVADTTGAGGRLIFVVLNIAVFVSAAVLAFARHDANPEFEQAFFSLRKARHKKSDLESRYAEEVAQARSQSDGRLSVLERWSDRIASEVRHLENERTRLVDREPDDIAVIKNVLQKRVLAYRQGNLEHRSKDNPAPPYFNEPVL